MILDTGRGGSPTIDEALKLVKKGKSFREAYQEVKEKFY